MGMLRCPHHDPCNTLGIGIHRMDKQQEQTPPPASQDEAPNLDHLLIARFKRMKAHEYVGLLGILLAFVSGMIAIHRAPIVGKEFIQLPYWGVWFGIQLVCAWYVLQRWRHARGRWWILVLVETVLVLGWPSSMFIRLERKESTHQSVYGLSALEEVRYRPWMEWARRLRTSVDESVTGNYWRGEEVYHRGIDALGGRVQARCAVSRTTWLGPFELYYESRVDSYRFRTAQSLASNPECAPSWDGIEPTTLETTTVVPG